MSNETGYIPWTGCISCEEDPEDSRCPNSKRPCGHHCNHSWTHDSCCWCGKDFSPIEDDLH